MEDLCLISCKLCGMELSFVFVLQVLAEQHERNTIEDRLSSEIDQLRWVKGLWERLYPSLRADVLAFVRISGISKQAHN